MKIITKNLLHACVVLVAGLGGRWRWFFGILGGFLLPEMITGVHVGYISAVDIYMPEAKYHKTEVVIVNSWLLALEVALRVTSSKLTCDKPNYLIINNIKQ